MATHSSVLAWRIPWMDKPGRLQSMGSHRVGHDWSDLAAAALGIIPHPLALFLVRLPKAHLTSPFRMSGSRWVTTPLWLSGSLSVFLYSLSGYSCHLSLISSAPVRSLPFLSSSVPIFAWNIPLVSPIIWKRSHLSHSIVFLYFFALIT